MATTKQKAVIKKIIENRGNISKSMREVGYSPTTAINPRNLTESKGFHKLCDQLGLTDDLLVKSLVSDIKKKKGHRHKELELGFKVKGRLNRDNEGNDVTAGNRTQVNILINVTKDLLNDAKPVKNKRNASTGEEPVQELLR